MNRDSGIAGAAFQAADGDFLLAVWLVLDLIWAGRLCADSRHGIVRA